MLKQFLTFFLFFLITNAAKADFNVWGSAVRLHVNGTDIFYNTRHLSSVFAAIGLCCSSFTSNSVVAFLLSAFTCLIVYFGFNALSKLPLFIGYADYYIEMLGVDFHYRSTSRGLLDSRDIIYFASLNVLFLLITLKNIKKH